MNEFNDVEFTAMAAKTKSGGTLHLNSECVDVVLEELVPNAGDHVCNATVTDVQSVGLSWMPRVADIGGG
jgi:hypothetical protein